MTEGESTHREDDLNHRGHERPLPMNDKLMERLIDNEPSVDSSEQTAVSQSDGPTQDQMDKWDEQRRYHQSMWEKQAAERNANRPPSGILRKEYGSEQTAMDVAHEEALRMKQVIESGRPSIARDVFTADEKVRELEDSGRRYGNEFFPREEGWEKDRWEEDQLRKEKNYWPEQQKYDREAREVAKQVLDQLKDGNIERASNRYYNAVYTKPVSEYEYDPRQKAAIDRLVAPAVNELAAKLFSEGDEKGLVELMRQPIGDLVYASQMGLDKEQIRKMKSVADSMAVRMIEHVAALDDKITRKIYHRDKHEELDYRGAYRGALLERMLRRLVNMGFVDSYDELVADPALREAAKKKIVNQLNEAKKYDSDLPHLESLNVLSRARLITMEEYRHLPELNEIATQAILDNVRNPDEPRSGYMLGNIARLEGGSEVDSTKIIQSPEGRQAMKEFLDGSVQRMKETLQLLVESGDGSSENGFNLWARITEKLRTLNEYFDKDDPERPQFSKEQVEELERLIAGLVDMARSERDIKIAKTETLHRLRVESVVRDTESVGFSVPETLPKTVEL